MKMIAELVDELYSLTQRAADEVSQFRVAMLREEPPVNLAAELGRLKSQANAIEKLVRQCAGTSTELLRRLRGGELPKTGD